jgi:hypothetical protein
MLEKQILRHIGLRARVNWREQGNALIERWFWTGLGASVLRNALMVS